MGMVMRGTIVVCLSVAGAFGCAHAMSTLGDDDGGSSGGDDGSPAVSRDGSSSGAGSGSSSGGTSRSSASSGGGSSSGSAEGGDGSSGGSMDASLEGSGSGGDAQGDDSSDGADAALDGPSPDAGDSSTTMDAGGRTDAGTDAGTTNLAPTGTGYLWSENTAELANTNRAATPGVNDGNLTTSIKFAPTCEKGTADWEAAGVVWSSSHTISSATFFNGTVDSNGDGCFDSGLELQFSTDGSTWTKSAWTFSPSYAYDTSTPSAKSYTFKGTAVGNVLGARVAGIAGNGSCTGSTMEVQVVGR